MRFTTFIAVAVAVTSVVAGPMHESRSAVSNAIKAVGQGQWSDEAVELVLGAVRKGDKKAIKTLQTAMKKNPPEGEVGPLTDVLKTKFDTEGSTFLKDFTGSKSKSKLKSTISSIFSFGRKSASSSRRRNDESLNDLD